MLKIEYVKTADLVPYANNPRKNDAAVDKVAESIREFGFKNPIIVDGNNEIIAGHTRLKAAEKLGIEEVPTIKAEDLTPEQVRAFRIADNKTHEFAEWDMDLLREELDGINLFTGFDEDELREILDNVKFSEVEEDDFDLTPPEEPKTKLGDIYQLGRHRLMCGDSTDKETIIRLMDGTMVDLLITDPPYNVDYEGKTKEKLKIQNDVMADDKFRCFLRDAFSAADAVMKGGAVFYIWHADSEGSHLWASDRKQTTILNFDRPSRSESHPTMKPVKLFDYQIQNNTKCEDVILDTFAGSGTALIACEQNGRVAYCCELDPKYCDVIINRWEQFTGGKAVRLDG